MVKTILFYYLFNFILFAYPSYIEKNIINSMANYIMKVNKNIDKTKAYQMSKIFLDVSKKHEIEWIILVCISKAESHFKINSDSGTAAGLMQVNYNFWNVNRQKLKNNIYYSIDIGAFILKETFKLVDKIYQKYYPDYEVPFYKYLLVYHGGTKRVFAKKFTKKEKIYIKNVYTCFDYFDLLRYVR